MRVLIVDVGGSNVKLWLSDREGRRKFDSGEEMTPSRMIAQTLRAAEDWPFDAVALGLPCRVVAGRPTEEPEHLGKGWVDFNYESFTKPVRIINDANLQAIGCYRGGRMLFVGLGTHVGSCLVADNVIVSLDLGHLLNADGDEIWTVLNKRSLKRLGAEKWRKQVRRILPRLMRATLADEVVIGGGQADELEELPEGMRRGSNADVRLGGMRLWEELPDPGAGGADAGWRVV